ncbi:hypothetical protein ABSA28_00411 [Candidatus Hepatincolaceae symbiont of Richtersius coronifer]
MRFYNLKIILIFTMISAMIFPGMLRACIQFSPYYNSSMFYELSPPEDISTCLPKSNIHPEVAKLIEAPRQTTIEESRTTTSGITPNITPRRQRPQSINVSLK